MIEVKNLTKNFSSHISLDNVNIEFKKMNILHLWDQMVLEKLHLFARS